MNPIAMAMYLGWWRAALRGDVCLRYMQPGHTAASCRHPLWGGAR